MDSVFLTPPRWVSEAKTIKYCFCKRWSPKRELTEPSKRRREFSTRDRARSWESPTRGKRQKENRGDWVVSVFALVVQKGNS